MAKKGTKLKVAEKRRVGLAGKALSATLDGEKLCDMLKQHLRPGPFDERFWIGLHVAGTVSEDTAATRFKGVELNFLIDTALAMMGFQEDHIRKLSSIAAELKRAELEDRKLQVAHWTDSKGVEHRVDVDELKAIQGRIEDRKSRLEEEANRLSDLVKTTVTMKGRVNLDCIALVVSDEEPVEEELITLKATKQYLTAAK